MTRSKSPKEIKTTYGTLVREVPSRSRNPGGLRGFWDKILLPLMDFPGVWYKVRKYESRGAASSSASALRLGKLNLPEDTTPDQWEFASRTVSEDEEGNEAYYVYARYTPEPILDDLI